MEEEALNFKKFNINSPDDDNDSEEEKANNKNESKENEDKNKDMDKNKNKKKGCHFPMAYTILLLIQIFIFLLSYVIPKGQYNKIEYYKGSFVIHSYGKDDIVVNATQSTLDKYKIKIPLENFLKGYIKNPIAIPGTYQGIENKYGNPCNILIYIIKGLVESGDISFFIMILGGVTSILTEMKALNAGIAALSRITKGKEFLLLCLVFVLISIGGTTFGIAEEIFGFYPILMPIFLKSGLDGILSTACLFLGSCVGTMFSTVNAFSVVLASYSAGVSFTEQMVFRIVGLVIGDILSIGYFYYYYRKIKSDPKNSIVYEIKEELEIKYLLKNEKENENDEVNQNKDEKKGKEKENEKDKYKDEEERILPSDDINKEDNEEFTVTQKIALTIFILGFVIMVLGVVMFNWWFEEMSSLFILIAIILMFISRMGEEKAIKIFLSGVGDFCSIALIIGIAKGINNTLELENISHTILYGLSYLLNDLSKIIFAVIMLFIFILIGFVIQSTSGLAVLAMPIIAPLADQVNCSRNVVVNAYLFGQALISLVAPTGYILIILNIVGIPYNYWVKFAWPFMLILLVYLIILILIEVISNKDICPKRPLNVIEDLGRDSGVIKEEQRAQTDKIINNNENNLINMNNNYMVRVKNLQKEYKSSIYNLFCCCGKDKGKIAIKNLNFCLERGECFGLLGLNGAGKTTAFKCITQEISSTSGEIFLNGVKTNNNFDLIKNQFGYCPQYDAIFEYMTVFENLEFYAKLKGVKKEFIIQIVNAVIYEMKLDEFIKKMAGRLSGGNKRKLSVAIAMLCSPPIILLDEPSTGMDPEARRFMWSIIHKISTMGRKSSIIMTTHSMDEAETLCKRMGIMVNGEFVCLGRANEIKNKYGYGYELNVRIKPMSEELEDELYFKKYNIDKKMKITRQNVESVLEQINKKNFLYEINEGRLGEKLIRDMEKSNGISISALLNWIFYVQNAIKLVQYGKDNFSKIIIEENMDNNFLFKMKKKEDDNKSIGYLFGLFETHKDECYITEYSIQQTSLEQIFNKFAENQGSQLKERRSTIVESGDVENIAMDSIQRRKTLRFDKIIVTDNLIKNLLDE